MTNMGTNNETVASPAQFLKWGLFPTIDGCCTDQSLFLQCTAVGLWGKWASVFLWCSEQLSWWLILSGMIIRRRRSSGRAWQVCSEEQRGKLLPARHFRLSGDTDNSCVIFPILSHWFSSAFILPFCLVSFSAARSRRWRSAPVCNRYVTLLHISVNLQQSTPNFNITHL